MNYSSWGNSNMSQNNYRSQNFKPTPLKEDNNSVSIHHINAYPENQEKSTEEIRLENKRRMDTQRNISQPTTFGPNSMTPPRSLYSQGSNYDNPFNNFSQSRPMIK